jgi:hypothetical protein
MNGACFEVYIKKFKLNALPINFVYFVYFVV